jgi:hypothetical protein
VTDRIDLGFSSARHEAAKAEVRVGDAVTKYLRFGTGQPVVVVRSSEEPSLTWSTLLGGLMPHCRILLPEVPRPAEVFSIWLRAFLDGLGLLRVGLVADQNWAVPAIEFALLDSDRIARLVLVSEAPAEVGELDGALADPDRFSTIPLLVIHHDTPTTDVVESVSRFLTGSNDRDD